MLSDDLSRRPAPTATPAPRTPMVKWTVDDATGIHVWYELNISFLDKTLARTKLEYLVCPILEHLHGLGRSFGRVAEQVLAHALLCCALLTRNLPQRPDLFLLNLAVGLDLAVDFRRVMDGVFGSQNWPKINPPSDMVPVPSPATTDDPGDRYSMYVAKTDICQANAIDR
ncbi:hypothetical protein F4859DRAFT_517785 [Xylaria cf. heliscus]|nr:hypothetical protein F4859DRAFT_517785 [Xylaria cf. heliscus]